ncbi:MAG: TolC family protein, partial [Caulobacteraceae bacterium]|nr:TolC family protein [Caulobacteraceae bacterium]
MLTACQTVGPDYRPPAGDAASSYAMKGDPMPAEARLAPATSSQVGWWKDFGSSRLDAIMDEALRGSPTLAEADANLARVQAEAVRVRGDLEPRVDANAAIQRERINTRVFGITGFPSPTITLYSIGPSVSYDLDLFGKGRRSREQADARAQAQARRVDAAYLTLTAEVALQAARIASLRARIDALNLIVADDRRTVDIANRAE